MVINMLFSLVGMWRGPVVAEVLVLQLQQRAWWLQGAGLTADVTGAV